MTGTLVHPLLLAEVNLAGQYNPPTYQDGRIPVYAFLILVGNDVVLVDPGVGEGNAYVDAQFAPERRDLETALAEYGVGVADVTMLINSHLHFDHCGNNTRRAAHCNSGKSLNKSNASGLANASVLSTGRL